MRMTIRMLSEDMKAALLLDEPIDESVSLEERERILIGMLEQGADSQVACAILGVATVFDYRHPNGRYLIITDPVPERLQ